MNQNQFSPSGSIFIALETTEENQEKLRALSNQVFRWSDDIWLMDVSQFRRYWRRRAAVAKTTLSGLWRNVLGQLFGETLDDAFSNVITMSPLYRASCAENPWLAVILLTAMREREVKGLVFQNSRSGESLLKQLSWDVWWAAADVLENRFLDIRFKGFKRPGFRKNCRRLKLAVPRLGMRVPWDMRVLNSAGVKKRYGNEIASLWEWTYGKGMAGEESVIRAGFPWNPFRFGEPPFVRRVADYPLAVWEQMVPLLTEDLDKLAGALGNQGEWVTHIDWNVTFEDLSTMTLPIRFRNPHDLQGESGTHTTTMLQAEYAFNDAMIRKQIETEDETLETVPPLLHWELRLSGTIIVPDVVLNIFGEMGEENTDYDVLSRLENELPISLNQFQPHDGWLPEDSYVRTDIALSEEAFTESELARSLTAVAEDRPLYIRQDPEALTAQPASCGERFLESAMNKWWRESSLSIIERDYFKHFDPDGKAFWVFRDSSGSWYQHGVFG